MEIEVVTRPPFKPRKRLVRKSRVKKRLGTTPKKKSSLKGKQKPKSVSKLKKEADAIFSKFIRARDKGQCYTCPNKNEEKKMQNGHFVPRQYLATRYDEVNNHCQCYACNVLYNGQPSAYAARLEKDYGPGTVAMLEGKRKELIKNFDYQWIIQVYTEKYEALVDNPQNHTTQGVE